MLHDGDFKHPASAGVLLNGLVMYATIYGCPTKGLPPQLGQSTATADRLEKTVDAMLFLDAPRKSGSSATLTLPATIDLATRGGAAGTFTLKAGEGTLDITLEADDATIAARRTDPTSELWLDDGFDVILGERRYVVTARGLVQESAWNGARWQVPKAGAVIADASIGDEHYGITVRLPLDESTRFDLALNDTNGTTHTRNAWATGDYNGSVEADTWGRLVVQSAGAEPGAPVEPDPAVDPNPAAESPHAPGSPDASGPEGVPLQNDSAADATPMSVTGCAAVDPTFAGLVALLLPISLVRFGGSCARARRCSLLRSRG
jgi:hypothetical protein